MATKLAFPDVLLGPRGGDGRHFPSGRHTFGKEEAIIRGLLALEMQATIH
ncbi:MAG TPA: hypothetical protein VEI52_16230 [Terriglobales bacterium]|nr:hypothetical protein [Terriglobales bacterium]